MATPRTYYDAEGKGHVQIPDPNQISKTECLALARLGKSAWNDWRAAHGVESQSDAYVNIADFSNHDFCNDPIDFSSFKFGDGARFDNTKFGSGVHFVCANFGIMASFENATFGRDVEFEGATLGDKAQFAGAVFGDGAGFKGVQFGGEVSFEAAKFENWANFIGARFEEWANFRGTQFKMGAFFIGSQFGTSVNGWRLGTSVDFTGAIFGDQATFAGVQFSGHAIFAGVQFGYGAHFIAQTLQQLVVHYSDKLKEYEAFAQKHGLDPSAFRSINFSGAKFAGEVTFEGRRFQGATSFGKLKVDLNIRSPQLDEKSDWVKDASGELPWQKRLIEKGQVCQFGSTPKFHECTFHQDTSFEDAIFPSTTGTEAAASAYRTLKLAFSKQQAIREEQRFFKLEIQEEAGGDKGAKQWLYKAYRWTSDFGFSLSRPLILLLLTTILSLALYAMQAGLVLCHTITINCNMTAPLVQFSLASALPGFEKLAEPASIALYGKSPEGVAAIGVSTVVTLLAQKGFSLLALFLIGLALRNQFKMK
jgi:uncharacterized protein YjbI with pentapeptide repeats